MRMIASFANDLSIIIVKEVKYMKGLKIVLLGIAIILIAGFFIISENSSLGGYGEVILLIIGLATCIQGVRTND